MEATSPQLQDPARTEKDTTVRAITHLGAMPGIRRPPWAEASLEHKPGVVASQGPESGSIAKVKSLRSGEWKGKDCRGRQLAHPTTVQRRQHAVSRAMRSPGRCPAGCDSLSPLDEPDQRVVMVDRSRRNLRSCRERRVDHVRAIADCRAVAQRRAGNHGSIADRDVVTDDNLGSAAVAQDRCAVARQEVLADGDLAARWRVDRDPVTALADRGDGDRLAQIGADRVAPSQVVDDVPGPRRKTAPPVTRARKL